MNIPNSLTIVRMLMIPVFVGLLLYEQYTYCLVVLLLAGLTDGLDGIIARVANQRTELGAFLDPLADKLLLSSGFITLAFLGLIPLWVAILMVSRDVVLMGGTLILRRTESRFAISPTLLGKGATVLQLTYMVMVILLSARDLELHVLAPLMYLMVAVTLGSGMHYVYKGFAHLLRTREA